MNISIVMSVYNSSQTLQAAIESILTQSVTDFEFVIVNDGSTDDSKAIIENYMKKDSRIKLIEQANAGLTKSLNRAISEAKGEVIFRQDADDTSVNTRIEQQLKFFPDYDFVCSRTVINFQKVSPKLITCFFYRRLIKFKNTFIHGTFAFKKDIWKHVAGYDESFKYAQDYEFISKILHIKDIKIKYLKKVLYNSFKDSNCISSKNQEEQQYFANKVQEKYWRKK